MADMIPAAAISDERAARPRTWSFAADLVPALVVLGCVVFGYGYYRLVEQPCAKWARTIEYRCSAKALPDQTGS